MAKMNSYSVVALLACLVAVNAAAFSPFEDEEGKPCSPCAWTHDLNFVCGSNGHTYFNPSFLKCHNKCLKSGVTQRHLGHCESNVFDDCPCNTTLENIPVCGTNGITYPNESTLKCAAKCQKTNIQIKHAGDCA